MAKFMRAKEKKKKKGLILLLLALALIICALMWMPWGGEIADIPEPSGVDTQPSRETVAETTGQVIQEEPDPIELSDGLRILHIGSYAGMYMEDGSNDVVSDVMMLILENTSDQDLQLARISMQYQDCTAEFEITNLPAGEKLVALESSRQAAVAGDPIAVEMRNVIFFTEPMDTRAETLEISGGNGVMTVKNISDEDITGDFYVYYKNSASDLLYGGITYRVLVAGGVAAGETAQVFAGHYTPESSRIISVGIGA